MYRQINEKFNEERIRSICMYYFLKKSKSYWQFTIWRDMLSLVCEQMEWIIKNIRCTAS